MHVQGCLKSDDAEVGALSMPFPISGYGDSKKEDGLDSLLVLIGLISDDEHADLVNVKMLEGSRDVWERLLSRTSVAAKPITLLGRLGAAEGSRRLLRGPSPPTPNPRSRTKSFRAGSEAYLSRLTLFQWPQAKKSCLSPSDLPNHR